MDADQATARTRIDKWLWAARFYKTRSLATKAVDAGQVRCNGERVKPAKDVQVDDVLRISIGAVEREVRIRLIAEVRGSAGIAQTLYAETEASLKARELAAAQRGLYREPGIGLKGRPTKRDRRQIEKLRGGD